MSENEKIPKNRIAKLRKKKKLSQAQLAKKTGLTRQAISLYEIGKREPKLEIWIKLADFFDVPTPYLQGVSNYTKKDEAEIDRLRPLMFKKNGEPNWDVLNKISNIENVLTIGDDSKRQFENANQIIDSLFSGVPDQAKEYKEIISNSKLKNFGELPEPVSTYTAILNMVSEIFFSAQSGDSVAEKCIQKIENIYDEYDTHMVEIKQKELRAKSSKNNTK